MTGKNYDAEKIILGGWLLGFHREDMARFNASDFTDCPRLAKEMLKGEQDPVSLANICGLKPKDLIDITQCYADFLYSAAVKDALKRRLSRKLAKLNSESNLTEVFEEFAEYNNYGQPDLPPHAENFSRLVMEDLDRKQKQETARTGLPGLDRYLHGIKRKEMTVIAARPSVGKSAFGLQLIRKLAEQGKKVLYFPLEMSTESNLERMLMHSGTVRAEALLTGELEPEEWRRIKPELEQLDRLSRFIYIYEAVNDINTIAELVDKEKPYAIVIDQLEQLRSGTEHFKDKRERFSHMTNTLQHMAMTRDIAVMLMCQVSRSAQNSEPTLANLKESGSIEEDADNVIILHRFSEDEMNSPDAWDEGKRPVLIKLEKHRHGATGNVKTEFMPTMCKFVEVEK